MRVVVVGAGRMGFSLAQRLDEEGHEVFLLDTDPRRIERARLRLDVMAVIGSGTSLRALRELGAERADLLVAASGSDEVNLVACLMARRLGVERRIARVGSSRLVEDLREAGSDVLGVDDFINPTRVAIDRLRRIVITPATIESAEFAEGAIVLRALRVEEGAEIAAAPLSQLNALFADEFRVAAVRRGGELIVPTGEFQITPGDIVYVVMRAGSLESFLAVFRFRRSVTRRVFLYGAEEIGVGLAAALEDEVDDILLIDPDPGACDLASQRLRTANVVRGSPLDQPLLKDLGIEDGDYFLGLSGDDANNLSSALLARRLGVRGALMLTGEPESAPHFEALPLDAVVSPLLLSVGAILRLVREGRVISLFNLANGEGEAIEMEVAADAPAAGRTLAEMEFPRGALVAAVIGEAGAQVAGGGTAIRAGDRVIVVTLRRAYDAAVALFSPRG